MLTVEQVSQILLEATAGAPLSIPGEEAKKLRASMEKDLAQIKARGQHVEIPYEWEIGDDFGKKKPKKT